MLALLSQRLGYTYLGDLIDGPANSNIEPELPMTWLAGQGVSDTLASGSSAKAGCKLLEAGLVASGGTAYYVPKR